MNIYGLIAVGVGGALGCWLRWFFSIKLTPIFPQIPLGTLTANLVAGFIIGITIAVFGRYTTLPPEARLFIVTGFLGGLSTFSTFSADVVNLLAREEYFWGGAAIAAHVIGSLVLTLLGMYLAKLLMPALG